MRIHSSVEVFFYCVTLWRMSKATSHLAIMGKFQAKIIGWPAAQLDSLVVILDSRVSTFSLDLAFVAFLTRLGFAHSTGEMNHAAAFLCHPRRPPGLNRKMMLAAYWLP